jgi:hypothetical protein
LADKYWSLNVVVLFHSAGEDNRDNANHYACALKAMVSDWRAKWFEKSPEMDPVFPFGEVQVKYYIALRTVSLVDL